MVNGRKRAKQDNWTVRSHVAVRHAARSGKLLKREGAFTCHDYGGGWEGMCGAAGRIAGMEDFKAISMAL